MKAVIVSYRRGRHTVTPNQAIIKLEAIEDKDAAKKFVGKKVSYKTKSGKIISGVITDLHGDNGRLRARFERGIPGQAIGSEISISDKAPAVKAPAKKASKKE